MGDDEWDGHAIEGAIDVQRAGPSPPTYHANDPSTWPVVKSPGKPEWARHMTAEQAAKHDNERRAEGYRLVVYVVRRDETTWTGACDLLGDANDEARAKALGESALWRARQIGRGF